MYNIGSAILILGCMYFNYIYGWNWWLLPFYLLGILTWVYAGFTEERRNLFKAKINLLKEKADYYNRIGRDK